MTTSVRIRFIAHRLPSRGPNISLSIPDVDVFSPFILDEVLVPASNAIELSMASPTVTTPRLRNRDAVVTVADDVNPRPRRARRGDDVFLSVVRKMPVLCFELLQSIFLVYDR